MDDFCEGCGCVLLIVLFFIPVALLLFLIYVFGILIPAIALG